MSGPTKVVQCDHVAGTKVKKVFLVRHGDRDNSSYIRGCKETPLTELGQCQAAEIGKFLANNKTMAIFTSPLLRTAQTASSIAARCGGSIQVTDCFSEWFNPITMAKKQMSVKEIRKTTSLYDLDALRCALSQASMGPRSVTNLTASPRLQVDTAISPLGEMPADFKARCEASWTKLLAYADKKQCETLVVVTHKGNCGHLMRWLSNYSVAACTARYESGSISTITIDGAKNTCSFKFGDVEHLDPANSMIYKNPDIFKYDHLPKISKSAQIEVNKWRNGRSLSILTFSHDGMCTSDRKWIHETAEYHKQMKKSLVRPSK